LIENQKELTIDLPKLPETWIWTTTGEVFEVASGGTPKRDKPEYWNGDVPWVTSGEVAFSDITDTQAHITQEGLENSSAKLCPPGTVLLALYGEGKTRGQAAILRISATTNQAIACILCSKTSLPSEYVYWWFYYRYMETRRIGEGANQPNIYLHHVKAMPFPLAPISDQRRIVARIDELFSLANAIEAKVKEAREQAEKIDQTILAKAFKGELVPQDPNDEPASVLVQRINTTTKQPLKAKAIQQKIL
jgi:type I restriction enzyme S subunit